MTYMGKALPGSSTSMITNAYAIGCAGGPYRRSCPEGAPTDRIGLGRALMTQRISPARIDLGPRPLWAVTAGTVAVAPQSTAVATVQRCAALPARVSLLHGGQSLQGWRQLAAADSDLRIRTLCRLDHSPIWALVQTHRPNRSERPIGP